jgi:1-phosphatidylinositol-4-phosphate 5-kinase
VTVWANGDRYEGEYRGGTEDGRGIYVWADGSRYEGEWREGKITGRGTKTWASGMRYDGEWRDDRPDGVGEAVIGGSRYVGTWVAGCFREGGRRVALGRPLSRCP